MLSVVACAALSRVCVMLLALLSNAFVPDHRASGVLVLLFEVRCDASRLGALGAFARWDAAHFLLAARSGWTSERSHAFFPLYPLMTRAVAYLLVPCFELCEAALAAPVCDSERLLLSALLLSNCAFIAAASALHLLGAAVLRDEWLARAAALLFCTSPASAFFSSCYSESPFAAAAFGGMLLRARGKWWAGVALLTAACAIRAMGIVHAVHIAYDTLGTARASAAHRRGAAVAAAAFVEGITQVLLLTVPYVAWQTLAYTHYCAGSHRHPGFWARAAALVYVATANPPPPPGWCANRLPDLYVHAQREHWGVGALRSWRLAQLPNFVLAAPPLLIFTALFAELRGGALSAALRPYFWHWAAISAIALIVANVQITSRLTCASCAAFYWFAAAVFARLVRYDFHSIGTAERGIPCTSHQSRLFWSRAISRVLLVYFGGYALLGTALHVNFYPVV